MAIIYIFLTAAAIIVAGLIHAYQTREIEDIKRIKSGRGKRREYDHDNPDTFYED